MTQQSEVGLFIDFENIRFGFLNHFDEEPDPQKLMEKARKYGPVAVAYAYADFTQHPPMYRRKLEVAGISPRDVPRRSPDVVHKSSADMAMLMDIIDCLLDRPYVQTLVLMTGDSDFIRVTARARHRFGKTVVIAGVPGSVSNDLVESADAFDPLVDAPVPTPEELARAQSTPPDEATRLLQLIVWLAKHRPYMTFGFIRSHAMSPHHALGLTEEHATELLTGLKESGVLIESFRPTEDGRTLRTLELNQTHARVVAVGQLDLPAFEEGPQGMRADVADAPRAAPGRPGGGTEATTPEAAAIHRAAQASSQVMMAGHRMPSEGEGEEGADDEGSSGDHEDVAETEHHAEATEAQA